MDTQTPEEATALQHGKEQILERMLEKIWHGVLVVVFLAGIASIMRFRYTGWLPIYNIHIFLVATYILCWWFRNRFSFKVKVALILGLFYAVGTIGIFSFGALGAGIWWLILCALMANMFYSQRVGIIHGLLCLGIIIAAGIAITNGVVTIPFDANEYITEPVTWLTLLVGCVFLSLFIIAAISLYQREILILLTEVEQSEKQLEELNREQKKALDEIRSLRTIIPICACCKKIRDDEGYWEHVEAYMQKHADMSFTHGLCPTCGEKLYGSEWDQARK